MNPAAASIARCISFLATMLVAMVLALFSATTVLESEAEGETSIIEVEENLVSWRQSSAGQQHQSCICRPSRQSGVHLARTLPYSFFSEHAGQNGVGRPLTT